MRRQRTCLQTTPSLLWVTSVSGQDRSEKTVATVTEIPIGGRSRNAKSGRIRICTAVSNVSQVTVRKLNELGIEILQQVSH